MIGVYKRLTAKEIMADVLELKKGVRAFFKNNPKCKTCNALAWYGDVVVVHKKSIDEDIDKAAMAAAER